MAWLKQQSYTLDIALSCIRPLDRRKLERGRRRGGAGQDGTAAAGLDSGDGAERGGTAAAEQGGTGRGWRFGVGLQLV
jgi:hypothetical protein